MIPPFDYRTPKTLREACQLLQGAEGKAKVIAGGTDLVIRLRAEKEKPSLLIDITNLNELQGIEESDGILSIGAAVSHSEIVVSPLVRQYGAILSEAASQIGSPQIRHLGTIGGNILNASPAADTLPPLLVLDAVGKVVSMKGEKEVPIRQLIRGPYEPALKSDEILVRIVFKKLSQEMSGSFIRLARRNAMAIARMSVALLLRIEDGRLRDVRLAPGSVLPVPERLKEVEEFLEGQFPEEEFLRAASRKVSEAMIQRSGIRHSTSYKAPVVEALFLRAMRKALERWQ
jgi:CO/xanthine dehydrogenase FAD-binding subunit